MRKHYYSKMSIDMNMGRDIYYQYIFPHFEWDKKSSKDNLE